MTTPYEPDRSLAGKLRRRWLRTRARRPALRAPSGWVSFSFDDAPASSTEAGAAVLEARGVRGTWFIASGLCGAEGHMGRFATEAEVAGLRSRGHEVGCHTFGHVDCARTRRDALTAELDLNAAALARIGVTPETFAYPYGDLSLAAKREVGRRFALARTVSAGLVRAGSDLAQAPAIGIEGARGEARALHWIAEAARERAWLILYTHDVRANASPFGCTPEVLARVADAALAAGLEPITVGEGARRLAGEALGAAA